MDMTPQLWGQGFVTVERVLTLRKGMVVGTGVCDSKPGWKGVGTGVCDSKPG